MASTFWRYGVAVVGVKNRCRKVDRHVSDNDELGRDTEPCEAVAVQKAKDWISANMKSVTSAKATATLWTVDNGMETWEICNDEHNLTFKID